MKLSWHLRKLSSPLYSAEICMLLNEHTYQDCEYIIRTERVVYESKFQRAIRSCLSLIPWVLYMSVQKRRTYNVCINTPTGIYTQCRDCMVCSLWMRDILRWSCWEGSNSYNHAAWHGNLDCNARVEMLTNGILWPNKLSFMPFIALRSLITDIP